MPDFWSLLRDAQALELQGRNAEAAAAYERFAAGGKFGKIILVTGSS